MSLQKEVRIRDVAQLVVTHPHIFSAVLQSPLSFARSVHAGEYVSSTVATAFRACQEAGGELTVDTAAILVAALATDQMLESDATALFYQLPKNAEIA